MPAQGSESSSSRPRFKVGVNRSAALNLVDLNEEHFGRLIFIRDVISNLGVERGPRSRVEQAARILGASPATVYRLLGRFKADGTLEAIPTRLSSGGQGKPRISPEAEELIQATLKRFLRSKRGQPVAQFISLVEEKALELRIVLPCNRTIRRRFEALSARRKTAHWQGSARAGELHNLQKGSTPPTSRLLERVQADHTRGDVWLVSEDDGTPLGRPWVTLVIDELSRVILAIKVTFAEPSSEELAAVLAIAVLPKGRWLDDYDCADVGWPYCGLPGCVYTDGGSDFSAHAARRALQVWNVRWEFRKQPHQGGIIESLIGHAMKKTRLLPGNTAFSKAKRHEDRIDPSKTATMTIREYTRELIEYFGNVYHHTIHPALGMTPHDAWNLACLTGGEPAKVSNPSKFYVDMLPPVFPSLQKYGLRNDFLEYRAPELQHLLNHIKGSKIELKIDPADVTRAFARSPLTGEYIELASEPIGLAGVTRDEWKFHQARCRDAANGQRIGRASIIFSIRTGRLKADEARFQGVETSSRQPKLSRAAKRAIAKREQIKRQVGLILPEKRAPKPTISAAPSTSARDLAPFPTQPLEA